MRTPTSFSMPQETLKKIADMADAKKVKRSVLIRELVEQAWKKFQKATA